MLQKNIITLIASMDIGETINSWTLLDRIVAKNGGKTKGVFQCKCGAIHVRQATNIINGHSTQCRHCARPKITFKKGEKINSWTFVRFVEPLDNGKTQIAMGKFRCDCGNVKDLQVVSVKRELSKKCSLCAGGIRSAGFNDDLFSIWHKLLTEDKESVALEWRTSFEKFERWAKKKGFDGTQQLTRIDSNLDYSSLNCTLNKTI